LKKRLKKAIISYLASRGLTIVNTIDIYTDKDSLVLLIDKLRPFQTDKDLIRLGTNGEGGYLVPDDLEGISACFSPGVGNYSTFEEDCLKYGMQVFLADKSVDGPSLKNDKFNFIKKFIGPITNEDFVTMDDWVNGSLCDKNSDLLLQMDIEGEEYFSIMNMSDSLIRRCRIIIIEFHDLNRLLNKEFFNFAFIVFQKVLQNHICVHIHPNNSWKTEMRYGIEIPRVAEFTFFREDRINSKSPQTIFPHPLDFDNTSKETLFLPKCWYNTHYNV
jgi:hypothetical protein